MLALSSSRYQLRSTIVLSKLSDVLICSPACQDHRPLGALPAKLSLGSSLPIEKLGLGHDILPVTTHSGALGVALELAPPMSWSSGSLTPTARLIRGRAQARSRRRSGPRACGRSRLRSPSPSTWLPLPHPPSSC